MLGIGAGGEAGWMCVGGGEAGGLVRSWGGRSWGYGRARWRQCEPGAVAARGGRCAAWGLGTGEGESSDEEQARWRAARQSSRRWLWPGDVQGRL
jgi:hypothetical protein